MQDGLVGHVILRLIPAVSLCNAPHEAVPGLPSAKRPWPRRHTTGHPCSPDYLHRSVLQPRSTVQPGR